VFERKGPTGPATVRDRKSRNRNDCRDVPNARVDAHDASLARAPRREFAVSALATLLLAAIPMEMRVSRALDAADAARSRCESENARTQTLARALPGLRELEANTRRVESIASEIAALEKRRGEAGRFLDAVIARLPNGVQLEDLQLDGDRVRIAGSAASDAAVARFAAALERPPEIIRALELATDRTISRAWAGSTRGRIERITHAFTIRGEYASRGRDSIGLFAGAS
jgi:hypothetical protein